MPDGFPTWWNDKFPLEDVEVFGPDPSFDTEPTGKVVVYRKFILPFPPDFDPDTDPASLVGAPVSLLDRSTSTASDRGSLRRSRSTRRFAQSP